VPSAEDSKPRGKQEVVEALLRAAAELFAERGPAAVSLRDVAKAADVNVGLIHRHIGSKEDLVAAVLRRRPGFDDLERLDDPRMTPATLLREVLFGPATMAGIMPVHARMLLDGYDLRDYQDTFPVLDWLLARLGEELPEEEARLRTALMVSLVAGWKMFGEAYLAILGLEDVDVADLARLASDALDALVEAPPATRARRVRRA
jgi:AcrR family transcriptional regulator